MKKAFKIVHSTASIASGGNGCAGGTCPTIYETNNNTFVIQGKILDQNEKKKLNIPIDEDVVEIPIEFLKSFLIK